MWYLVGSMEWLGPAVLAPVLWAVSNLVDGRLVRSRALSAFTLCAITGAFGAFPAVILHLAGSHHYPGWRVVVLAGVAGLLSLLSYYPYYRALDAAHPAIAVLLWNIAPAAIAVLAFLFLGERLLTRGLVSVALLVASALVMSFPSTRGKCSKGTIGWMLLASTTVAAEAVLLKWLFAQAPFEVVMVTTYSAGVLLAVLLFAASTRVRRELARSLCGPTGLLVVFNEAINMTAGFASSVAISLGAVSVVKAVGGLQPLFVLGFSVLAGQWLRSGSEESRGRPTAWVALVATGLAVCGLALLG